MTENAMIDPQRKEALKNLRAARRESITAAAARVKVQKKDLEILRGLLREEEGRTVPELAEASGLDSDLVLWYVAALKKYGEVLEGKKDGGFYRYLLAPAAAEGPPAPEPELPGSET
jgi:predicted transcriptional regulator